MENPNVNNDNAGWEYVNIQQPVLVQKELTKERKTVKEEFQVYGFASIIYAIVFTICMYKNLAGIASTILVIATVVYAYFILKRLGYSFYKKHIVYAALLVLLGINLMITMDPFLHFIDYVAIIMILVSGILSVIYNNSKWDLGDSVSAIIMHCLNALSNVFDFVADWSDFAKDKSKKSGVVGYIILGAIITVPLVAIVLVLLGSADVVFGNMLENIFEGFEFGDIIGIGFVFVGALLGAYAWLVCFVNKTINVSEKNKRTREPAIMIVIGVSLGIIYLVFCGIQIMYLFAGVGQLPEGYTYAQYAREGFSQLMFVCLLNLVIVLVGTKYFRENIALKIILTVITACTYMMIVSSAYRMYMYISVYQMSVLRIWVLWTLIWLTFILTGALVSIYNNRFSLFTYSMIATSVLYLLFAYARPEYLVAKYNLSDIYEESDIDYAYIRHMNPDACSVVLDYYNSADDKAKHEMISYFPATADRYENQTTARNFNISRYKYYSVKVR